jgi:hypothetical protein
MSDMIPIGGLWKQESANGKRYLSGAFGFAKILIFVNDRKEPGSNQPDYSMFIAPTKKQQQEGAEDAAEADRDLPF